MIRNLRLTRILAVCNKLSASLADFSRGSLVPVFSSRVFLSLCLLLLPFITSSSVLAEGVDWQRLAKVKAAYLYNVIKFTEWPELAEEKTLPIVVGIIGEDGVTGYLHAGFKGRRAQNRPIEVLHLMPALLEDDPQAFRQKLARCHLIYLSDKEGSLKGQVIEFSHGAKALTTSGLEGFASSGGMVGIRFDREADRVVFEINLAALSNSGLMLSSKLLKFATIVERER
jgi:hypothetical protein